MRRWWMIACVVLGVLSVLGCATSGGALAYDPANPPSDPGAFALPDDFRNTQTYRGWRYLRAAAGTSDYQPLVWGTAPAGTPHGVTDCWCAVEGTLLARERLCTADGIDTVIAWRAPRAGTAQLTATLRSITTPQVGDGVVISMRLNETVIIAPSIVLNQAGPQQSLTTLRTVKAGDNIYLRVNPRDNAEGDWFIYSMEIALQ